jgi:hypothetical protein
MNQIELYKMALDALEAEKQFGCCAFYVEKREAAIIALTAALEEPSEPKRLTDAEIMDIVIADPFDSAIAYARAVETAVWEKQK